MMKTEVRQVSGLEPSRRGVIFVPKQKQDRKIGRKLDRKDWTETRQERLDENQTGKTGRKRIFSNRIPNQKKEHYGRQMYVNPERKITNYNEYLNNLQQQPQRDEDH